MKIYDESSQYESELSEVLILLTKDEMREFRDTLNILLSDSDLSRHEHVDNGGFDRGIIIGYDRG